MLGQSTIGEFIRMKVLHQDAIGGPYHGVRYLTRQLQIIVMADRFSVGHCNYLVTLAGTSTDASALRDTN